VKLIVEHEQIARRAGLRVRRGFEHLDGIYVEEFSKTSFIARKEAAIPPGPGEKSAPVYPQFLAAIPPASSMRASLLLLVVWGTGMYSPFEIIRWDW